MTASSPPSGQSAADNLGPGTCEQPQCLVIRRHHTHEDAGGRMWCCGPYPYTPAVSPPVGTVEPDQQADEPEWVAPFFRWATEDKSPGSYSAAFAAGWRRALAARPVPVDSEQREKVIDVLRVRLATRRPIDEIADELLALLSTQPEDTPTAGYTPTCGDPHQYHSDGLTITAHCALSPGHEGQHVNRGLRW